MLAEVQFYHVAIGATSHQPGRLHNGHDEIFNKSQPIQSPGGKPKERATGEEQYRAAVVAPPRAPGVTVAPV